MHIDVRPSEDGQWYYMMVSSNGQPMPVSETYTRRSSAVRAAKKLREDIIDGTLEQIANLAAVTIDATKVLPIRVYDKNLQALKTV